jgi:hypothetical protein
MRSQRMQEPNRLDKEARPSIPMLGSFDVSHAFRTCLATLNLGGAISCPNARRQSRLTNQSMKEFIAQA